MTANTLADTLDIDSLDSAVGRNIDKSATPRWHTVFVAVGRGVTAVEIDEFGQSMLAGGATTITLVALAGDDIAGYVCWDPDQTRDYATWVEDDLDRIVEQLHDNALLDPDGPCDEWKIFTDEGADDTDHVDAIDGFETVE